MIDVFFIYDPIKVSTTYYPHSPAAVEFLSHFLADPDGGYEFAGEKPDYEWFAWAGLTLRERA